VVYAQVSANPIFIYPVQVVHIVNIIISHRQL